MRDSDNNNNNNINTNNARLRERMVKKIRRRPRSQPHLPERNTRILLLSRGRIYHHPDIRKSPWVEQMRELFEGRSLATGF